MDASLPPSFHSHNFLNYPVNARCYSGFHRDDLGRRSTRSIRVLVILYIGVRMALVSGSPFPFFSFLDRFIVGTGIRAAPTSSVKE